MLQLTMGVFYILPLLINSGFQLQKIEEVTFLKIILNPTSKFMPHLLKGCLNVCLFSAFHSTLKHFIALQIEIIFF